MSVDKVTVELIVEGEAEETANAFFRLTPHSSEPGYQPVVECYFPDLAETIGGLFSDPPPDEYGTEVLPEEASGEEEV